MDCLPKENANQAEKNFKAPVGYDDHLDHITNFFDAINIGKIITEDAGFDFRAVATAFAPNERYLQKKNSKWDHLYLKR